MKLNCGGHLKFCNSCFPDSGGMWDDLAEEEDDDEEEDEGLAGQLLSDLIASNKYGKINLANVGLN